MSNDLQYGGARFNIRDGVFPISTDSVMLAHFVNTRRIKHCVDLGCGAGVIAILLAAAQPELNVTGIELDPVSADNAVENVRLNNLAGRVNIINGDIRSYRELHTAGSADLVVSNPPYYAAGRGKKAVSRSTGARGEENCSLLDVCSAASYFARWGASFCLVHKPERLSEVFKSLAATGFEPKRMRFVQYKPGSAPSLVLIQARRGGNPSLTIEAPLVLTDGSGNDSPEAALIYSAKPK